MRTEREHFTIYSDNYIYVSIEKRKVRILWLSELELTRVCNNAILFVKSNLCPIDVRIHYTN